MGKLCKRICLILIFILISTAGNMFASDTNEGKAIGMAQQQKKLVGTVSDNLGPVVGATVTVKGTTTGTITDNDGQFTLTNIPNGAIIQISFMGYHTQEINYTGQESLNIRLVEDSKLLDEIVVTALGIKKERRALPYAMGEIKSEDLRTVPTQNLGSSLYGKVAGMQIASTAGGPMGGTKIQLRGINSIGGVNRPLIILDGIPIHDDDSKWDGRERNQTQQGSALNDINSEDIESISVLKGGNAAALYGLRATNGVILITTKKGSKSQGLGIDVSTSYTTNRVAYLPEYQNVFGVGTKGYFDTNSDGQNILEANYRSFGPRMDGTNVLWWDGVVRPFNPQPDNFKDLFQNGFSNNNTISITNGSENTSMRLSYANNNYEGFLQNMKQVRHNFNLSGTAKLSEWLSVNASVSFNRIEETNSATRIDRVSNYPMPRSEIAQLYKDHYRNADGYYMTDAMKNGTGGSGVSGSVKSNIIDYMLWQQNANRYTSNKDRWLGNIAATIKVIDPLSIRLTVGTDRIRTLNEDKEMFKEYSAPGDNTTSQGLYRKKNIDYTKNFFEAMMLFDKQLSDKLSLSLMGAFSSEDTKESSLQWQSSGLKINGMFSTQNTKFTPTSVNGWGTNGSEVLYGLYGSGQLAYNHYLYFDITARNDWTSRLPSYSRSFFYPSFGLGFVFTDAFQLPSWLTYGKVRASYAIVGNHAPSRYFASNKYTQETYDGGVTTNSFSSSVPPVRIVPEKTYSWEFGTELKALNGRIGLDFSYFTNETRNQILDVKIPISTGSGSTKMNAGSLKNHGVEFQLTGTPVQTKNFRWDATLNLSHTKSTVDSFSEGLTSVAIGGGWNTRLDAYPGEPTYGIYLKKWKRDDNGELLVNANGYYIQDTEYSYMGDAMPTIVGGFSNTFTYKDLSLTVLVDGQFGGKMISFTNIYLNASGAGKGSLFGRDEEYGGIPYYIEAGTNKKIRLDSHSASAPSTSSDGRVYHDGIIAQGMKESDGKENDILISAYQYYNSRYNQTATEDQLYKSSYVKLRELSLTYNMPASIYSKAKLKGLSLSLIGSNLFYIYKSIPNVTPESTLGTGGANAYLEYTAYPSSRQFGFSLKAKF